MSIVSFRTVEREGKLEADFTGEFTRVYRVKCDSEYDEEIDVLQHPDCPVLGRPPAFNPYVFTKSVHAKYKARTNWHWFVTATFSTDRPQDQPLDPDPTKQPAEISIKTRLERVERYTDLNGDPILNTAGDLIKKAIDIPRETIHVAAKIGPLQGWIKELEGVVNDSPIRFKGQLYDRGTVKLMSAEIGKTNYGRYPYDECQLEFEYHSEGWFAPVLNMGFYELIDDPKGRRYPNGNICQVKVRCLTDAGEPETELCFLDINGRRPRTFATNAAGKAVEVIKRVLTLSDLVLIPVKDLRYYDFKKLPIN